MSWEPVQSGGCVGKQEVGPSCQGKLRLVMPSSEHQAVVQDFSVGREA